jgi:argininosuccinate lyase
MTILIDEGIEFQPKRLAEAVAEDFSNATDVADYLAAKGVPFREAYQLVGKLVKTCTSEGILLKDLSVERWKTFHPQFEADIVEAITPAQVVKVRNSYGGTGIEQVKVQVEAAKKLIA